MALNKISLMDAFIIETIRSKGVSNEDLIQNTLSNSMSDWKEFSSSTDLERLLELAENEETFKSIIEEGYKIKFVTINGLKNLMKLKFQIFEDKYHQVENGLINLEIHKDQLANIKQFISDNWKIHKIERNESYLKVNILVG